MAMILHTVIFCGCRASGKRNGDFLIFLLQSKRKIPEANKIGFRDE